MVECRCSRLKGYEPAVEAAAISQDATAADDDHVVEAGDLGVDEEAQSQGVLECRQSCFGADEHTQVMSNLGQVRYQRQQLQGLVRHAGV